MSDSSSAPKAPVADKSRSIDRKTRSAEALRENLKRRKQQARLQAEAHPSQASNS